MQEAWILLLPKYFHSGKMDYSQLPADNIVANWPRLANLKKKNIFFTVAMVTRLIILKLSNLLQHQLTQLLHFYDAC